MLRYLIACAFLTLPLVACATEEGEEIEGTESAIVTGRVAVGAKLTTSTRVNLRRGPSTRDGILRTLPAGTTVTALDAQPISGFYRVKDGDDEGWTFGAYLNAESGAAVAPSAPADGDVAEASATDVGVAQDGTFDGRRFTGQTVLYQGDWGFLTRCDSYSRRAGRVVFFCNSNSTRAFVDDGAWVAMPGGSMTRANCDKRVKLCKGDRCVVAKVVEKSVTGGKWEGSKAVLAALGVSAGWSSCTSSFGTATGVTITME